MSSADDPSIAIGPTSCESQPTTDEEDETRVLHARIYSQLDSTEPSYPDPKQFIDLIDVLGHTLFTTDQDLLLSQALDIAASSSPTPHELIDRYVKLVWSTRTKLEDDPELDEKLVRAASNALSVLNYGSLCGILDFQFCRYLDWRYCRIPKANLNMAVFAPGTSFDYADMRGVFLFRAHCHGCSFRHTDLRGASTYVVSWLWSWSWSWTDNNLLTFAWSQDGTKIAYSNLGPRTWKLIVAAVDDASIPIAVIPLTGVSAAAFSPDGVLLATADSTRVVKIWNILSQKCLYEIKDPRINTLDQWWMIPKLCYSSDGAWLAFCHATRVYLYDAQNDYTFSKVFSCEARPSALAFSPDNRYLAAARHQIYVWELSSATLIAQFDCSLDGMKPTYQVECTVAFSDDGKSIYYSDDPFSRYAQQWDLESQCRTRVWTSLAKPVFMNMEGVIGCKPSFDSASIGDQAESKLSESSLADELAELRACKLLSAEPVSDNRQAWASRRPCGASRFLSTGDLVVSERVVEPSTPWAFSMSCVWEVAAADWCFKLKLHLHQVGKEIRSPDVVNWMAVSPDGSMLATAKDGEPINLWDLHTGQHVTQLGIPSENVRVRSSLSFSPDGRYLLESSLTRAQLWDVLTRLSVAVWQNLSRPVNAQFSLDGNYVVCKGGGSNEFKVFETSTQTLIESCRVTEYHAPHYLRCISSDRRFIISTRNDRNDCVIKIWDVAVNKLRCEIRGLNKITAMALSADDSVLAVANGCARLVQVWHLNLQGLIDRDPNDDMFENGEYNMEGIASPIRVIGIGQEGDFSADFTSAKMEAKLFKTLTNFTTSSLFCCRFARSWSIYVSHLTPLTPDDYAHMQTRPDTGIQLEFDHDQRFDSNPTDG